jgi:hypothetical protein
VWVSRYVFLRYKCPCASALGDGVGNRDRAETRGVKGDRRWLIALRYSSDVFGRCESETETLFVFRGSDVTVSYRTRGVRHCSCAMPMPGRSERRKRRERARDPQLDRDRAVFSSYLWCVIGELQRAERGGRVRTRRGSQSDFAVRGGGPVF